MISNRPWGYETVVDGYAPVRISHGYSGYRGGYYNYKRHDHDDEHDHHGHNHHDHDGHRHKDNGEWREGGDVTVVNNGGHRHGGDTTVVNNHKRKHDDNDRHRESNRHGDCRRGKCDDRDGDITVINNKRQTQPSGSSIGGAPGYIDVTVRIITQPS